VARPRLRARHRPPREWRVGRTRGRGAAAGPARPSRAAAGRGRARRPAPRRAAHAAAAARPPIASATDELAVWPPAAGLSCAMRASTTQPRVAGLLLAGDCESEGRERNADGAGQSAHAVRFAAGLPAGSAAESLVPTWISRYRHGMSQSMFNAGRTAVSASGRRCWTWRLGCLRGGEDPVELSVAAGGTGRHTDDRLVDVVEDDDGLCTVASLGRGAEGRCCWAPSCWSWADSD
jgi:hypothetical protein